MTTTAELADIVLPVTTPFESEALRSASSSATSSRLRRTRLSGRPPYGPDSANLNLVLRQTPSDPISGSSPLRASGCDVSLLTPGADLG
jgi:hypothetical protein